MGTTEPLPDPWCPTHECRSPAQPGLFSEPPCGCGRKKMPHVHWDGPESRGLLWAPGSLLLKLRIPLWVTLRCFAAHSNNDFSFQSQVHNFFVSFCFYPILTFCLIIISFPSIHLLIPLVSQDTCSVRLFGVERSHWPLRTDSGHPGRVVRVHAKGSWLGRHPP